MSIEQYMKERNEQVTVKIKTDIGEYSGTIGCLASLMADMLNTGHSSIKVKEFSMEFKENSHSETVTMIMSDIYKLIGSLRHWFAS